MCPCRSANKCCSDACKCGTLHKPCKNKLDTAPALQQPPLQQQVAELEIYVDRLSVDDVKKLCCRVLCGRGGISLAKSILESDFGPEYPTGGDGYLGVYVGTVERWILQLKMCATVCPSVLQNFEHLFNICLDHMVLSLAIHNRSDIRADPVDYSPASYRKAAYHQYILWAHGYFGRGNRRVVPSCVVLAIRRWYPSPTGIYMGFREY